MKKFHLFTVVFSAFIFTITLLAPSGAYPSGTRTRNNSSASETYMIINMGDEYKVVPTSRLKDEKKKVDDDYTQELKECHDLGKTDPCVPRPRKLCIKKIKIGYLTPKIAQEYVDKLTDEAADQDNGEKRLAEGARIN